MPICRHGVAVVRQPPVGLARAGMLGRLRLGVVALLATWGCSSDQATEPQNVPVHAVDACGHECLLISDVRPIRLAQFSTDSAGIPVQLGSIRLSGSRGSTVGLVLRAEAALLAMIGTDARVFVSQGGVTQTYSLGQLLQGVTVHRFEQTGSVKLTYGLERRFPGAVPTHAIQLVQVIEGDAEVTEAIRPWIGQGTASVLPVGPCAVTAAVTQTCSNTVTVNPFFTPFRIGGTFTSKGTTEASAPISVAFNAPVQTVYVRILDSDFSGNQATATGGGSWSYSFDGQPGNGGVVEVATLEASPNGSGITAVALTPAANDYVSYDLWWDPLDPIKVECLPNPVQRGQQVTCTATPRDQGATLTVSEWRFDGPDLSGPVTEQSASTTWSGTAATAGTVRVQGEVNGVAGSGRGPLVVSARQWSAANGDSVKYSQQELLQQSDALPDHPTAYGNLGRHDPIAGALPGNNDYTQVSAGPNNGVFYLVKVPVEAISRIHLNRVALAVNSDFYNLQGAKRKNKPGDPLPWCARADVPPFLPKAIDHEGLGSPPPAGSHADVFRRELNARVPQAVEDVVALGDLAALQTNASAAADPQIAAAVQISDDAPTGTVAAVQIACWFMFFTP
jgi:hypothetical protein